MPLRHPNAIAAANIRLRRLKRNWSQEELATRCGLHRTYVGAIERGERNVTLDTLFRVASALGCSCGQLITDKTAGDDDDVS